MFSRITEKNIPYFIILYVAFEYVALGKFSAVPADDNIYAEIPYLAANALQSPLAASWYPWASMGTDGLATGFFSLGFRALFAMLPGWLAFQVLAVLPIAAGVFGVYGLARYRLGLSWQASAFAAFVQGFLCSRGVIVLVAVPGYLPMLLLAIGWLLDRPGRAGRWLAAVAGTLWLGNFSFISHLVPWPLATVLIWFAVVERRRGVRDWLIIAALSALLFAPRLSEISTLLAYAPLSALSEAREQGWTAADQFLQFAITLRDNVLGRSWVNFVCLLGLVVGVMHRADRPSAMPILQALLAAIALHAVAVAVKVAAVEALPFLRGYRVGYLWEGYTVFIALAGGIAYGSWQSRIAARWASGSGWGRLLVSAPALYALLAILPIKIDNATSWITQGNYVANFESPVLDRLAARLQADAAPWRAVGISMYGVTMNAYGIETIEGWHPLQGRRFGDLWRLLSAPQGGSADFQEAGSQMGVVRRQADAFDPSRLESAVDPKLLALANVRYVVSKSALTDPYLKLLDDPGVNWRDLSTREKIFASLRGNYTGRTSLHVYELAETLPRAFAVSNVTVQDDARGVLDALRDASLAELSETAFVDRADWKAGAPPTDYAAAKPRIVSRTRDEMLIDVDAGARAFVVVSAAYSPYWCASIDGTPAAIVPVDRALMGVEVPEGGRRIALRYRAPDILGRLSGGGCGAT